jgi:3-deoxy-D-manno-octulosonic-acid transferase
MGMLTYLYRLADLTYIGDGFGGGIHSILEPAAFGMPIFFGPNYRSFQEAVDLVERKGVFAVKEKGELIEGIRRFVRDEDARREAGQICRDYIREKKGATERVMTGLRQYLGEPRRCQGSGVRDQGSGIRGQGAAPPDG